MIPRRLFLAGAAALGGCSVLPQPDYVQVSTWPLAPEPPARRPARRHGKVLLVRGFQGGPGLNQRGVQWLNANGSVHVDFYNVWEVAPAQAATAAAQAWLAASGLFAAVIGADSGLDADLALEAELTAFTADPRVLRGQAGLSVTLLNQRAVPARVLTQRAITGTAKMPTDTPVGVVAAQRAALADVLRKLEAVLARIA
jgi:cholesterol transport system auxiliary component